MKAFWNVAFYLAVVLIVVVAVFPFYYAIITSFKTGTSLFEVNYWAPMALVAALLPALRASGSGAVVNVSSLGAITPIAGTGHYPSSKAALATVGLPAKDLDWVVAHQATMRILQGVSQRLEIPMERFYINIHKYGNTSSASIGIALDEAVTEGKIKPGQTVLMCALGAGISWGSALVRW